jgi:protocatechuate 3,4-dioxygenase beta subunit
MITRLSSAGSSNVVKIALAADSSSIAAGNSTLVRASVTTGDGAAVVGTAVTFSVATNNSGASLVPLNGGVTDASGTAVATYTAGANNPTVAVQDILQASITGATGAIIITRTSSAGTSTGLKLTFTSSLSSLEAGESCILTAKVTDSSNNVVANEPVTFSFVDNVSGAHLTTYSTTTDAGGEATTVYTAGSVTATTVQDIIQASITGSSKALIITRTGTAASVTPAYLDITASPLSIKSDGSTTSTITVKALNSNYAEISDVVVTMKVEDPIDGSGTPPGVLGSATVTTPGTVTFSCGSNKWNRTATITGTAGAVSAQVPVKIYGTTVTIASSGTSLPHDDTTTVTLTITVKDAGGNAVSGKTVTMSQVPADGGSGSVTFGATTGTTNTSGVFTTTAMGSSDGEVTITATAMGASGSTNVTVAATGSTFNISSPDDPAAMTLSDELTVTVNAPSCTQVLFATTIGAFDDPDTGGVETGKTLYKAVSGGVASATLYTDVIGLANVEVSCSTGTAASDTLTVSMTSGEPAAKVVLQAASTVVPLSSGSTTYYTTLTATVYDASNNPLKDIPVAFSIVDGTGTSGGEKVSPVTGITDDGTGSLSMGKVQTNFYSGSISSSGTGVKVRATVIGSSPSVETGTTPSGNDAAIVIGGTAGSIAFGWDSKAKEDSTGGNYEYKMSVVVADANGNPVPGAVVSLGVWPIAWAPGTLCDPDPAGAIDLFYANEDLNENLILDGTDLGGEEGEDGTRYIWDTTSHLKTYIGAGTVDYLITPTNSVGGTVPSTVTTGTNGVAGFVLTYPKSSGVWIWDRIRATTIVQGTETRAETYLHLNIVVGDESICNESPFQY